MRFLRRVAVSIPMAAFLAVVLAGQTVGATWSAKTVIDQSSYELSDLVTFSNGTAIAAIEDCVGGGMCTGIVVLRRSTDGGMTWGPRMKVAPKGQYEDADMAALAGRGKFVDLVWRGTGLLYKRSGDQGLTFGRARYITHESSVREPDIARGPDGVVAISWGEWPKLTDQISVRVSSDGGRTFGPKHSWPTTTADWSTIAVGDGVTYLAHYNAVGKVVVRRSTNAGQTWRLISNLGTAGGWTVAAEGSEAYIAWISPQGQGIKYRRTVDRGVSWSPAAALSPPMSYLYDTVISLQGGVARALYGGQDFMYYRQSADGLTWSPPRLVSQQPYGFVGRAGDRVVLLFHNFVKTFAKTRPV